MIVSGDFVDVEMVQGNGVIIGNGYGIVYFYGVGFYWFGGFYRIISIYYMDFVGFNWLISGYVFGGRQQIKIIDMFGFY